MFFWQTNSQQTISSKQHEFHVFVFDKSCWKFSLWIIFFKFCKVWVQTMFVANPDLFCKLSCQLIFFSSYNFLKLFRTIFLQIVFMGNFSCKLWHIFFATSHPGHIIFKLLLLTNFWESAESALLIYWSSGWFFLQILHIIASFCKFSKLLFPDNLLQIVVLDNFFLEFAIPDNFFCAYLESWWSKLGWPGAL